MIDFPHPLRLARGSHQRGSGKGCAMNIVSYQNGDTKITDFPACSDPLLAELVQHVNDRICRHLDDVELLCSDCSLQMLELAHRTVGTNLSRRFPQEQVEALYVHLAADEIRTALAEMAEMGTALGLRSPLTGNDRARYLRAVEYAEEWSLRRLTGSPRQRRPGYVFPSGYVRVGSAEAAVAEAISRLLKMTLDHGLVYGMSDHDAHLGKRHDAAVVILKAGMAHYRATPGRYDAVRDTPGYVSILLPQAHRVIDRFQQLAGLDAPAPVDPQVTAAAYAQMVAR